MFSSSIVSKKYNNKRLDQFLVGMGNFSHGYRTFSSLFYFHSILYMPYIEFLSDFLENHSDIKNILDF